MARTLALIISLIVAGSVGAIVFRHDLTLLLIASDQSPPLSDRTTEAPGARWFDDYFLVRAIDDATWAIGEPRYHQQNFSYLIAGTERAILFDAGPGLRDIRQVVDSLTDLPLTFVPSHFHFDHVGNEITFDRVAVVDLPYLRSRAPDGRLRLTQREHLGMVEGIEPPVLEVDEWLAPGTHLELGGRTLQVLYAPGHTEDSIALLDQNSGQLFSGDFIYPGLLFALFSNSGLGDYLQGAQSVLAVTTEPTLVLGAHRSAAPDTAELERTDIIELRDRLLDIRAGDTKGSGIYPVEYVVNDRITLLAEPRGLQRWTPRRPHLAHSPASAPASN